MQIGWFALVVHLTWWHSDHSISKPRRQVVETCSPSRSAKLDAFALQVGAEKELRTVIEGESLFNDGTAYVLFLLFEVSAPCTLPPMH